MEADRCLYIGNLSRNISESILYEIFLQAGPLEDVTLKENFAFVTYEDEESVPYACSLFEGLTLYGTELVVKPRQHSKYEKIKIRSVPPFVSRAYTSGYGSPSRDDYQPKNGHSSSDFDRHARQNYGYFPDFSRSPYPLLANTPPHADFWRNTCSPVRITGSPLLPFPPLGPPPDCWPTGLSQSPSYSVYYPGNNNKYEQSARQSRSDVRANADYIRERSPISSHGKYRSSNSFEKSSSSHKNHVFHNSFY